MERDGNGWWTETHADHVEGVHADVGDDVDDLILRHELHLQHRLKEFGIPSPLAIGRWYQVGGVSYLGGREDGEVRVGLPGHEGRDGDGR